MVTQQNIDATLYFTIILVTKTKIISNAFILYINILISFFGKLQTEYTIGNFYAHLIH